MACQVQGDEFNVEMHLADASTKIYVKLIMWTKRLRACNPQDFFSSCSILQLIFFPFKVEQLDIISLSPSLSLLDHCCRLPVLFYSHDST